MKKILIVEDDKFLAEIYKTKFEKVGFIVDIAPDGEMALKKIKDFFPDLVLLDIVLPKLDGWKILEILRGDEKLKNLKVIVFSNLFEQKDLEKGIRFGVLRYFVKADTTPDEVVAGVKDVFQ